SSSFELKTENRIKSWLEDMKVQNIDMIPIYKIDRPSCSAQVEFDYKINYISHPHFFLNYNYALCLGKDYQNFPLDQQKFIVGHEASHIKNHHSIKEYIFEKILWKGQFLLQPTLAIFYNKLADKISNKKIKSWIKSPIGRFAAHGLLFITG